MTSDQFSNDDKKMFLDDLAQYLDKALHELSLGSMNHYRPSDVYSAVEETLKKHYKELGKHSHIARELLKDDFMHYQKNSSLLAGSGKRDAPELSKEEKMAFAKQSVPQLAEILENHRKDL